MQILDQELRLGLRVLGGILLLLAMGVGCWILWEIMVLVARQPADSVSDLAAQGQTVLGFANTVLALVLVLATLYYACQSRNLVKEARSTRLAEQAARDEELRRDWARRIEGAANALVGASGDLVRHGVVLAVLLRRRRLFRVTRGEAAMQPVTAASRALDELRYLAPGRVSDAGEQFFDTLVAFYQAATAGSPQARLDTLSRAMHRAKLSFQEAVTMEVETTTGGLFSQRPRHAEPLPKQAGGAS